jgi:hypothetical protein
MEHEARHRVVRKVVWKGPEMRASVSFVLSALLLTQLGSGAVAQPSEAALKDCREKAAVALKERPAEVKAGSGAAMKQETQSGQHDPAEQAMVDQCLKNGGRL